MNYGIVNQSKESYIAAKMQLNRTPQEAEQDWAEAREAIRQKAIKSSYDNFKTWFKATYGASDEQVNAHWTGFTNKAIPQHNTIQYNNTIPTTNVTGGTGINRWGSIK